MTKRDSKFVLLILFAVLLLAVGFEQGAMAAFAVGLFFGKIYVLRVWLDTKRNAFLILYLALFVLLAAITHIYVALLSLSFFAIPWAVIKASRFRRG